MSDLVKARRLPVGAEVLPGEGVHFRIWAPRRKNVALVLEGGAGSESHGNRNNLSLIPESDGYFSVFVPRTGDGTLYRFKLDEGERHFPDPASRFQPDGPTGPSQVVDPGRFHWSDDHWKGVTMDGQVFYELHIGTFTKEGTYESAIRWLPNLADLGVTLIQMMPVAEFSGRFGWGYDGVDLYAPTRLYGTPDDLRRFVDRAHSMGLAVILDVVYNHLGPVGNILPEFSDHYFSKKHVTEWGEALNFDGEHSGPVREFIIHNAMYWIGEFHIDGLRIDATQSIFDDSGEHVLKVLTRKAREAAGDRSILIVGENEPQNTTILRAPSEGGFGMDGVLNDDFHHTAMVALTGRTEAYYRDYTGTPQEFISSAKWGYLYQGQYYLWQKKRRGKPAFGIKPAAFVNYLQNHDQVGNSFRGERCKTLTSPTRFRAMTALLFLMPTTPLLFMGQEFCASTPFVYFADHAGELGKLVREGRADFLKQFKSLTDPEVQDLFTDPADLRLFEQCKLDHSEKEKNFEIYALHRDLIRLRREDPVFNAQRSDWLHGAVLGPEAFLLRYFGGADGDRLLLFNFGRDVRLEPAPEPLLAAPLETEWEPLWSSESPKYGGRGTPPLNVDGGWILTGQSAIVLISSKQ